MSTGDQDPGLQLDALLDAGVDQAHMYTDRVSGTREDRPGLTAVLAAVHDGDSLTVWRLDRLGRSTSHLIATVEDLGARGVQFRSLCDPIDTTSPGGRLIFTVFAAIASFERELTLERTAAGLAAARRRGVQLGRPTRVSPAQLDWIRKLAADGHSHTKIAELTGLSRAGVGRVLRGEIAALNGSIQTNGRK